MMNSPHDAFLETAGHIAARLCRDALWAGDRCNWLGPSMERVGNRTGPVYRTFGPDLYGGTAGIALFLARAASHYTDRLFRMTALGAARQAISRLEDIDPIFRSAFYTGHSGIAYALLELGEALDEEEMVQSGLTLVEDEDELSLEEQGLDVLSGMAGSIPMLIHISRRYKRPELLERARSYGEQLLRAAHRTPAGWSWNTMKIPASAGQPHLLGFSHGVAGVAWALLELYSATGEERFAKAAAAGFQYERGWFSPAHQNWPDLRSFQEGGGDLGAGPSFMVAWCHGAPGIALSRLRAFELTQVPVYRQEATIALQTTAGMIRHALAAPPQESNYSLCHGLAGNAAVLLYGYQVLGDASLLELAQEVGVIGVETYDRERIPWPGGVQGAGEAPGLMLGTAGTGHFYLRLHDPARTPSIVILVPEKD